MRINFKAPINTQLTVEDIKHGELFQISETGEVYKMVNASEYRALELETLTISVLNRDDCVTRLSQRARVTCKVPNPNLSFGDVQIGKFFTSDGEMYKKISQDESLDVCTLRIIATHSNSKVVELNDNAATINIELA